MARSRQYVTPKTARLAVGLVGTLVVTGLLGTVFAPVLLLRAPVLLVALAPDARHVALAVANTDPVLIFGVTVMRRWLFSIGMFGLGARYGDGTVSWLEQRSPRWGGLVRLLERWVGRFEALLAIALPTATVCVLVGASHVRFVRFAFAVLLGHVLWVGTTVWLGRQFAGFTRELLELLSSYGLEATLLCLAVVIAVQLWSRR